ncbi:tetratricopeptide repeat protein [Frigidibacter sp. ROC022]|uniref:tetratricopeptide repeat protein n=1 Tax=Frigidibacter sp. ROC022 TaxID=2971796 RepID=UPI00215B6182|nr:tetratricopeptide repeat protein [Frigidibacter sp. ROC022]MCR8723410.1 tetratricopeptide repeat protein [Frigidibacter sp. ROC022]
MFDRLQQPSVNSEAVESQIWEEWSKSGSPSMDLLLQRGRAAMEEQDWASAIGFFTALTDHAPDFAEGWNARATAYYNSGLYGPALADIRTALRLNPRHFGALSGLALILEDLGHPEDAIEVWHKVQELTPYRPAVKEAIERLDKELTGETL